MVHQLRQGRNVHTGILGNTRSVAQIYKQHINEQWVDLISDGPVLRHSPLLNRDIDPVMDSTCTINKYVDIQISMHESFMC